MAKQKKMEASVTTITPNLAKSWLAKRQYIVDGKLRQRKIRRHIVEQRKRQIETGTYDSLVANVILCRCNGKCYLTDGQHMLSGVVESQISIVTVVRTIYCDDMAEVQKHFANTDIGLGRTSRDAILASGIGDEYGLSDGRTNALTNAMPIIIKGFNARSGSSSETSFVEKSNDLRLSMVEEWIPYAKAYFDIVPTQKGFTRHFQNAAVLAVGVVTVRYQEDKASRFWPMVADDSGLTRRDPAKVLREKLIEISGKKGRDRISQEYQSRMAAVAWNAFYEGRKIGRIQVMQDTSAPGGYPLIKISGTPYTGKRLIKPNVDKLLYG